MLSPPSSFIEESPTLFISEFDKLLLLSSELSESSL